MTRSWSLISLPHDALPIPGWRFLLPGVPAAMAWLRELGIARGDRVGLAGANTPATAALLQAAPLVGVSLVLFHHRLGSAELSALAARARVGSMLADPGHPMHRARTGCIALPEDFAHQPLDRRLIAALAPEDPALVLFTSGTTGVPKAARLSMRALAHAAHVACERLTLTHRDAWLGCLPLDHIGGAGLVHRAAACGYRLRLMERFDAAAVDAALDADGITGASVVPTMLHRLVAARGARPWPSTLRVLLTGGGPLSGALAARASALGLEPCQTYGLTECASQVCTVAPGEAPAHRGQAGRPLSGMEVAIHRADGSTAPIGESGAIMVRGAALFSGYEEGADLRDQQPSDRWFATGDLGELDRDGFLTVHCRRLDLIISGGENVYPAAVEAVLETHPRIREAGVCGVPDEEWGQLVAAVVVADGAPPGNAEMEAWLESRLPGFARPRRWIWAAELPRSPLGKLARDRLAALLARRGPDDAALS